MSKILTLLDYRVAASDLGVPVATVKAVTEVESNGSGFLSDSRVKVQYEPHVMYQQLTKHFGSARANAELAKHSDLVASKPGSYQSTDKEDKDMARAATTIDRSCALQSASWGAFQIMGYHWKTCGYPTLQAFINAQYTAAGQLDTFVRFIKADNKLLSALKSRDWATFARIYNGPAYAKNRYDTKLESAYTKYQGVA
ncbi:N-acetylmuramidase family protein [Pectobacterium sp. 21LCBS03]|uniref:N-acetylmuramidase family protein n=1 Tax=unclassified Pectobacterium TaxID=2627739 RepID=UPI00200EB092|nr:N-acetylmuramidase family protein [Pectobacterium sp. 21LCBS03]UPY96979.1 N-acetylmuramidase family protein [Pectobacterium sp. 21LCBS03]